MLKRNLYEHDKAKLIWAPIWTFQYSSMRPKRYQSSFKHLIHYIHTCIEYFHSVLGHNYLVMAFDWSMHVTLRTTVRIPSLSKFVCKTWSGTAVVENEVALFPNKRNGCLKRKTSFIDDWALRLATYIPAENMVLIIPQMLIFKNSHSMY